MKRRPLGVLVGLSALLGLSGTASAHVDWAVDSAADVQDALGFLVKVLSEPRNAALVLSSEYVGGFLAIALLGSGRPSADQMLQRVADAGGTLYGRLDPIHGLASGLNEWTATREKSHAVRTARRPRAGSRHAVRMVSTLFITGSGPVAVDNWLRESTVGDRSRAETNGETTSASATNSRV